VEPHNLLGETEEEEFRVSFAEKRGGVRDLSSKYRYFIRIDSQFIADYEIQPKTHSDGEEQGKY
jgi:hypothetical protein